MNFILFCLLRRWFVKTEISGDSFRLIKGIFFKRRYDISLKAAAYIETKSTPLLRLFGAKKITIRCVSGGGCSFYQNKSDPLPFSSFTGAASGAAIVPSKKAVLFGALVDTRALSGIAVFSLTLSRMGNVFGEEYYDKLLRVFSAAAEEVRRILTALNIIVPAAAALLMVFVFAAWLFAMIKKQLNMARFTVAVSRDFITIRRGVITLYEYVVVRNNINAAVCYDTLTTLLLKRAPIYTRGIMLFPPCDAITRKRLLKALGLYTNGKAVVPPKRALFGHCAQALGFLGAFTAGYAGILIYSFYWGNGIKLPLIRSLLIIGAAISLWYVIVCAIYMFRSKIAFGGTGAVISSRHGVRLRTAYIPSDNLIRETICRNPFQKRSGLCDVIISIPYKVNFKLGNIPNSRLLYCLPN